MRVLCVLLALGALASKVTAAECPALDLGGAKLEFIGEATFPVDYTFQGTTVGGLSGIDYDACTGTYYIISDDRSEVNAARFYTATISVDASTGTVDVQFTGVTTLKENGATFPKLGLDPESIRVAGKTGTLFWSSEGEVNPAAGRVTNPTIKEMGKATGETIRKLNVPAHALPVVVDTNNNGVLDAGDTEVSGVRNNLAFESIAIKPKQAKIFVGTENALVQDGPVSTATTTSPSRITGYDIATGDPFAEYVYIVDKATAAVPSTAFTTNGLVELLSVGHREFLALERSFATGVGNNIQLYVINLQCATNVLSQDTLDLSTVVPVQKTLLANLGDLSGVVMDNVEGITIKKEEDGSLTLVAVSDNNFSSSQVTQFLVFKLTPNEKWSKVLGKCVQTAG